MKKLAAAAAIAALALTGCAAAHGAGAVVPKASTPPASNIYEAVLHGWEGTDRPSERWIDTAAMLVCKQIIGGIEPRVVANHAYNNEVVVAAAEDYLCEIDR